MLEKPSKSETVGLMNIFPENFTSCSTLVATGSLLWYPDCDNAWHTMLGIPWLHLCCGTLHNLAVTVTAFLSLCTLVATAWHTLAAYLLLCPGCDYAWLTLGVTAW
jgi:hypothetical protein